MPRFIAKLNDGSYINVTADRLEQCENMLYAYNGKSLVAVVEITALIVAYLCEKGEKP